MKEITPQKHIKKLNILTKQLVSTPFIGHYKSVFKGRGLEFDGYREYTYTDDSRLIDWKASMRTNQLLIKEFIEERNLNVFFLIDSSSSMVFGSTEKLKNEYSGEVAASLAYVIQKVGDSIGFALFNNKIQSFTPPYLGEKQFYLLLNKLTEKKFYGGGYNFIKASKFILANLRKGDLVIILSDFIGLKGEWKKYITMLAKKFELIGIMIRDPRDDTLPDDGSYQVVISDPFSDKTTIIQPKKIKNEYERYAKRQKEAIKKIFLKNNSDFLELNTSKEFLTSLIKLFKRREKRLR